MKTVKQYFVTCVETVECKACGGTGRISIATDYATTGSGTITSRCLYCDAGQRQTSSWIELSEALRDLGMVKGLTATAEGAGPATEKVSP